MYRLLPRGSFVLRLFSLSCRLESQERSQGRVSAEYSPVFQVCPFRVMVSTDWSMPGRGSLVIAVGPGIPHQVLLLFWACTWNTAEAQMLSLGRSPVSGCKLLLQFVQLTVSASPFHLPRNFPSSSLFCLSSRRESRRADIDWPLCPMCSAAS